MHLYSQALAFIILVGCVPLAVLAVHAGIARRW